SPAMLAALAPLHYLENEAAKDNEVQLEAYAKNLDAYKLRKQVAASLEKNALKKGKQAAIKFDLDDEPEEPKAIRYRTNGSTYEKLDELLLDNPTGLLLERDELCSLLQHLDREEQAQARSFFMTGWAGSHPYTFDRIIRGHIHIEAVCLSVLGNTQPTRISQYVCRAPRRRRRRRSDPAFRITGVARRFTGVGRCRSISRQCRPTQSVGRVRADEQAGRGGAAQAGSPQGALRQDLLLPIRPGRARRVPCLAATV